MKTIRNVLVAGVASMALAGLAGHALAGGSQTHVMTVQLPSGAVEQIRYTGDVAPQIVVNPDLGDAGFFGPVAWNDPFPMFARISAQMDREMNSMLREARVLSAEPFGAAPGVTEAALGKLPAGTESYSFVSTMSGNGVCGRSVQVTSEGPGHKPNVVTKSFGNCNAGAVPSELPGASAPASAPGVVEVKSDGAKPYAGLIHEASWQ
jgi:hypothetical protein